MPFISAGKKSITLAFEQFLWGQCTASRSPPNHIFASIRGTKVGKSWTWKFEYQAHRKNHIKLRI